MHTTANFSLFTFSHLLLSKISIPHGISVDMNNEHIFISRFRFSFYRFHCRLKQLAGYGHLVLANLLQFESFVIVQKWWNKTAIHFWCHRTVCQINKANWEVFLVEQMVCVSISNRVKLKKIDNNFIRGRLLNQRTNSTMFDWMLSYSMWQVCVCVLWLVKELFFVSFLSCSYSNIKHDRTQFKIM